MTCVLEIDNVYTAYDKADVLQGISLTVSAGCITCLLGSNGSGKTTLVRSILGLRRRVPVVLSTAAPTSRDFRHTGLLRQALPAFPREERYSPNSLLKKIYVLVPIKKTRRRSHGRA